MYYITHDHLWDPRHKTMKAVARLSEFKPIDGKRYYVRTAKRDRDSLNRIYIGKNGKLVRTVDTVRFHDWGMKTHQRIP